MPVELRSFCMAIACLLICHKSLLAQETSESNPLPDFLVVRDGWQASQIDVKRVLESTAIHLWQHFPDRELDPIVVYPKGGPIVLYDRGPKDEYVMMLNTGESYWAQYAFQFSHEFCHILCVYDTDPHSNNWFEESICELASLYTLRQMSESWKTDAPYDHWQDYGASLYAYAEERIGDSQLEDQTLAEWYRDHSAELHASATKRNLNNVVAVALLPLFEDNPENWAAIQYLNSATPQSEQTFEQYLSDWYRNSPEDFHTFISEIASQFEITLTD